MRVLALALLLAAGAAAAQPGLVVRALDDGSGEGPAYRFDPTTLEARPGQLVTVRNEGRDAHTFTHDAPAAERAFHTGAIEAGATAEVTLPATPASLPFVCVFHGGMRGVVEIADAEGAPPAAKTPLPLALALAALAGGALVARRRA